MSITTTTHLNFAGTARQALEFYQAVFGGDVTLSTYRDFGMPAEVPARMRSSSVSSRAPTVCG